ncbi:protein telomere ends associated-like [Drosophila subobscura]|uniref:protein telomere ends associated-like n=1 Tax=Drosophila subobscura TaxID=7241 RepID=UPI00155B28F8|nr:protein telomere ends associated-like [Drosophila subobscura]XP_034651087.1 protein telomere ends associated-like [Drosophila subobscura]
MSPKNPKSMKKEYQMRHQFKLRSSRRKIRDKFRTLPEKDEDESPGELDQEKADGVRVKVDNDFSFVSYEEFQKYVDNLFDIVWHLKLNDPEYVPMGFEECAHAYYLAFYLKPEIRGRYKYRLKTCTRAMSARLLAIPTREQAEKLKQNFPEFKSSELVEETVVAPVSFQFFQSNTKNLKEIIEKMRSEDQFKNLSKEKCAREYFRLFYSSPEIRERFQVKLKPCPRTVRETLLSQPTCSVIAESLEVPMELDGSDLPSDLPADQPSDHPMRIDPHRESLSEPVITFEGVTHKYPISQQYFCQNINYDHMICQLRETQQYNQRRGLTTILTDQQLMQRFYHCFYTNKEIRQIYHYTFKADHPVLRNRLLQFAKLVGPAESNRAANGV